MKQFCYPKTYDDAKYHRVIGHNIDRLPGKDYPAAKFSVEIQNVVTPDETFFRVIYTQNGSVDIHVTYEGNKPGARANFHQTMGSLRSGREPTVMGRGLRWPHSKTSLGRKKFSQLKRSGELATLRFQATSELIEFDAAKAARMDEELQQAILSDRKELETVPYFGMF